MIFADMGTHSPVVDISGGDVSTRDAAPQGIWSPITTGRTERAPNTRAANEMNGIITIDPNLAGPSQVPYYDGRPARLMGGLVQDRLLTTQQTSKLPTRTTTREIVATATAPTPAPAPASSTSPPLPDWALEPGALIRTDEPAPALLPVTVPSAAVVPVVAVPWYKNWKILLGIGVGTLVITGGAYALLK